MQKETRGRLKLVTNPLGLGSYSALCESVYIDVFMQPKWDITHSHLGERSVGICVFLNQPYTSILLILDESGECYERSGFTKNTSNKFTRNGTGDSLLISWQDVGNFVPLSEIGRQQTFLLR
jgi:hypothetical protein